MSLKGIESRMLGVEHQRGGHRETELGTDPSIFASQPGGAGEPGVVERRLVRVERMAARILDDDGLRYRIRNPAEFALLLKEFLLRSFSIFDVGITAKPPDEVAFSVELWNDTYEEPSVLRRTRVSSSPGLRASTKASHSRMSRSRSSG
jgi:hypothetical protein